MPDAGVCIGRGLSNGGCGCSRIGGTPQDRRPPDVSVLRLARLVEISGLYAVWDTTLPTVISYLDRSMRAFGGVPTYWLTDNEHTVSTGHVAGIAVRAR